MLDTLEKDFNRQISSYEDKHDKFRHLNQLLLNYITSAQADYDYMNDNQASTADLEALGHAQATLEDVESETAQIDEANKALEAEFQRIKKELEDTAEVTLDDTSEQALLKDDDGLRRYKGPLSEKNETIMRHCKYCKM